jgi:Protein of unknown function (DUF1569)
MKHLLDPEVAADIKRRIASLNSGSVRQWGKMDAGQAMAHCAAALELVVGDARPKRMAISWLLGGLVASRVLRDDAPLRRNTPTAPSLMIRDTRDVTRETARVSSLIDRVVSGGAAGITTHPHTFFGKLTPQQWAVLSYKHLDHHLRQFGA